MTKERVAELRELLKRRDDAIEAVNNGEAPHFCDDDLSALLSGVLLAAPELLDAAEERDEYKRLLVDAINAVQPGGRAVVSETCSIGFLRDGPAEVRMARGAIERDRDSNREGMFRLQREVVRLRAMLTDAQVVLGSETTPYGDVVALLACIDTELKGNGQ